MIWNVEQKVKAVWLPLLIRCVFPTVEIKALALTTTQW